MAINERPLYPDKLKFRLSFNYLYIGIKTRVFSKRSIMHPAMLRILLFFLSGRV